MKRGLGSQMRCAKVLGVSGDKKEATGEGTEGQQGNGKK